MIHRLPAGYIAYMQKHGVTQGELSVDPGWYELWPLDQLEELNSAYSVPEYAPSLFGFGSNGAGEMLAFNSKGNVVMIPFIPMAEDEVIVVAETWADFEHAIAKAPA